MKRFLTQFSLFLLLLLTLCGCGSSSKASTVSSQSEILHSPQFQSAFQQLTGDLYAVLDDESLFQLQEQFLPLWQLYRERVEDGELTAGRQESRLWLEFSETLDELTLSYFSYGDGGSWSDQVSEEAELAAFSVEADGSLGEAEALDDWEDYPYRESELAALWGQAEALLPEGSLQVFDSYTAFTDGSGGTLAYVYWDTDGNGTAWGLALDPADSGDETDFQETVLHEYFHYLSLNEDQALLDGEPDGSTYWEDGLVTLEDSYLNQFYETFWPPLLLEERLANPDSSAFFLRHYSRFYDDYASTSPSEDIAECFAIYCLWEDDWDESEALEQWERKILWFDQFPELKAFREEVRERIGYE